MAHAFVRAQTSLDDLQARAKREQAVLSAVKKAFHQAILLSHQRSYHHATLGRFLPRIEPHAFIKKPSLNEDEEIIDEQAQQELIEWSKTMVTDEETGHTLFDELFGFQVKSARLKALVKERVEAGESMPPGVDFYPEETITWWRPPELRKGRDASEEQGRREEAAGSSSPDDSGA